MTTRTKKRKPVAKSAPLIPSDGLALLRTVNAAAHDDTARLVAADWFADLDSKLGRRIERELRDHPPNGESDSDDGGGGYGVSLKNKIGDSSCTRKARRF